MRIFDSTGIIRDDPVRASFAIQLLAGIILACLPTHFIQAQQAQFRFERLTIEQGLSQNSVNDILQDKTGYIWIATRDGLNRFDGYEFRTWRFDPLDSTSISGNYVDRLFPDQSGNLWVVMGIGGICFYELSTGNFYYFHNQPDDSTSLSGNLVTDIAEDQFGTLWIATTNGLNRFVAETRSFERFMFRPNVPESLPANMLIDIQMSRDCCTNSGFWVGTAKGLVRVNFTGESRQPRFQTLNLQEPINVKTTVTVTSLAMDSDCGLWAGTLQHGVFRVADSTAGHQKVQQYASGNAEVPVSGVERKGMTLEESGSVRRLWVQTAAGGLDMLDAKTGTWRYFRNNPSDDQSLPSNAISSVRVSGTLWNGTRQVWIATYNQGLCRYDAESATFIRYQHDAGDSRSLSDNRLTQIFEDAGGVLWIGTDGGGLNKLDPQMHMFGHYKLQAEPAVSRKVNTIRAALYVDESESEKKSGLWLGTDAGLYHLPRLNSSVSGNPVREFRYDSANVVSLSSDRVQALEVDSRGNLWIGTLNGLNRMDPGGLTIKRIFSQPHDPKSLSGNVITSVLAESDHTLWVGTAQSGLNRGHVDSLRFKHYTTATNHLLSNKVWSLLADTEDRMWVGTAVGSLARLDKHSEEVTHFRYDSSDPSSLNNYTINSLYQGKDGTIWVGTYSGGLNRLIPGAGGENDRFVHYTTRHGLPNNMVQGIVGDNKGQLWLSTNKGVAAFNPLTNHFTNYNLHDGLQSDEFLMGAITRSHSGEMIVGGINGYNYFHPDSIKTDDYQASIVVTDFRKLGESVKLSPDELNSNTIALDYEDNVFSFELALLDYHNPASHEYAYYLDGFRDRWIYIGRQRHATFTNLNPGSYVLRFKARSPGGEWQESQSAITLVVNPPLWRTAWFRTIGIIVIVVLVFLLYKVRVQRIHEQKTLLAAEVTRRTAQLEHKNQGLEKINGLVKSINQHLHFDALLDSILKEAALIQNAERSTALIYDREKNCYRFTTTIGWKLADLEAFRLSLDQCEARYIDEADELFPNTFVLRGRPKLAIDQEFQHLPRAMSMLIMKIEIDGRVDGYFIFDNFQSVDAFDDEDIFLLRNLHEHIRSAFIRARILDELRILNQRKNEFVGIAAHDLRNPLTSIIGRLSIMVEKMAGGQFDKHKDVAHLQRVLENASRMSTLINELLDIAAIESGRTELNLKCGDLGLLVERLIQFYQSAAMQKQIELVLTNSCENIQVEFDESRIEEVLDNLVSNGLKYTQKGGRVEVRLNSDSNHIHVDVVDNGQGLETDEIPLVFDSFKKLSSKPTAGESSTGLGLSIVKKFVELHSGRIWVESRKGHGSTFSFSLPLKAPESHPAPSLDRKIIRRSKIAVK